uniref:Beta-lactamase-related domain-containing protein n=1 Tax=Amphimedon queenslandica TaxID=400682 RepID=A0A1X7UMG0_AMPQE
MALSVSLALFLLFSLSFREGQGADKVIPHEPLSVIKSYLHSPSDEQLSLWRPLIESSGPTRESLLAKMLTNIKHLVQSRAIVMSLDGQLILESFPETMKWNTSQVLPNCNVLTLITSSLTILLEGHEPDIFFKALRELSISKKKLNVPQHYQYMTLMSLFNKLPDGIDRDSKTFNIEFNVQCHVAFQAVNHLLGRSLNEAWNDAFMSLQLDESILNDQGHPVVPFFNLYRLTEVIHSDLNSLPLLSEDERDIYERSDNYAFGWWMNAGIDGNRLLDTLPNDAMFSMSPTAQIFVIPSLKMSAVFVNNAETSWAEKTYDEVLFSNNELWRQVLLIINPEYSQAYQKEREERMKAEGTGPPAGSNEENENEDKENENEGVNSEQLGTLGMIFNWIAFGLNWILGVFYLYLEFTSAQHIFIRILLWVVFISVAHVVVYWSFHIVWKTLTILFSRTHESRPKAGKTD